MQCGGNFGAPPQPPCTRSNICPSACTVSLIAFCDTRVSSARCTEALALIASASRAPCSRTCSGRWDQASSIASITMRQLGMPGRGSGGK